MKIVRLLAALASLALFASTSVLAQQQPSPASTTPQNASDAAVRDALAKKEGDADQATLLKDTLTAVDKQYSLLRKGKFQVNYDLSHTYIGQEKINADLSSGTATLFSIENTSSHTITNTFLADYGLRNNLTASLTLPLVSRWSDSGGYSGTSHTIGDIGLGVRWQPFETRRDDATITFTGGARIASGKSPYKVDAAKGLATGSGVNSINLGLNATKIADPVALFASFNAGYSLPAKHLTQNINGALLRQVDPGASIGFGMGFAFALSYKITTSFSFQESISARSKLTFDGGRSVRTATQTAGVLSIGAGYRVSPKTTVNLTVGAGLTASAPNMVVSLGLPLAF